MAMLKYLKKRILFKYRRERLNHYTRGELARRKSFPSNLMNFEKKHFSQFGEDGVIAEIFRRIGTTGKFFVEFGFGFHAGRLECNTTWLLESGGWSGVWLDGSAENVELGRAMVAGRPVKILQRFLTRENIAALFQEAGVPGEFDLLSIDVDGNDYWLWRELKKYRPRVVVIEYNSYYVAPKRWVMPYDADHRWDGSNHFGASLESLAGLGNEFGYTLVGCESHGVNAFFVRNDLVGKSFPEPGKARHHYVAGKYNFPHLGWIPLPAR